jgi:hypothetical protein
MKRIWKKPVIIPSTVSLDREYIELFATIGEQDVALALIAPEIPVHADNGRVKIQWLIGNASAGEKKLRKLIKTGLDERLLEKDDPSPWTTLVYQCYDSETLHDSDDGKIGWAIEHSLPTAPQRPEWLFDDLPDDELIACCLWEYARESHTIGMAAAHWWLVMRRARIKNGRKVGAAREKWEKKEEQRIVLWLEENNYDYMSFHERFWQTDFPLIGIYETICSHGGSCSNPWQMIADEGRRMLIRKVDESHFLRPLVPASVGDLEHLWEGNNSRLLEIRASNLPDGDDCEYVESISETQSVEIPMENERYPERLAAAFTVDFSRFTDREILDAFRDWLKQTRPAEWERPRRIFPNAPQRGRKLLDYRVALERLALMRLLNDNYPDDLRKNHPAVWKKLCRSDTHFRRECKLACDFFHALFPFLPEDESPRCSKPVEIWEPEIEEELARKESDELPPTGK